MQIVDFDDMVVHICYEFFDLILIVPGHRLSRVISRPGR